MDGARARVLEMLAAGKVSAEQAERLFEALGPADAPVPLPFETVEKLGRLAAEHGTWRWNWRWDRRGKAGGGEQTDHSVQVPLAPGGTLRVRAKHVHVRVTVQPEARAVTVKSHGQMSAEVTGAQDAVCVSAGPEVGNLAIEAPPLARLELAVNGGHAKLEGATGDVHADVTGGHLKAAGDSYALAGKCLGGHVKLDGRVTGLALNVAGGSCSLSGLCLTSGEHRLSVMGGHANVALSPDSSVRIRAKARGGHCKADLAGSKLAPGGERVVGAGEALLELHASGGHINLCEAKEQ